MNEKHTQAETERARKIIRRQFDLNQDDLTVFWVGSFCQLLQEPRGDIVATMRVDGDTIHKIRMVCAKNNYRCSAVQGDKILV